jgi:nucleotide-binding universal stress UspA family protein
MFENVLVGLDGRSTGRDAIALARQLLEADGTLTLVHVRPGALAEEESAQAMLEREQVEADVDAQLVAVVASRPGRGLHQQAEDGRADLIVVGSCARGMIGRAMLGDDTRAALNGAPCAVAIAPAGYATAQRPFTKVGVAYNGSAESEVALQAARTLAGSACASVHALHVVSLPSTAYARYVAPGLRETRNAMLEDAQRRMDMLSDVEGRAVHGVAGEELAAFGDELDILVVGSRGYGPMRRLLLGGTSDYLQRHARCALLVLPRCATADQAGVGT